MLVDVVKPGLLSSVQDHGRRGYYHLGIPPSGAMDQISFRSANLMLGNPETAAALECALMGPELTFPEPTRVCVTGARMPITLDGVAQPLDTVLEVAAGQTLSSGFAAAGARAYLAVAGGVDVPEVLGSRSTYALGALGGFHGRSLQAGDQLPVGTPSDTTPAGGELPAELRQPLVKEVELRMIRGLYDERVQPDSMATFLSEQWTVASEADRIGYRLKGGTPLDFVPRTPPFGARRRPVEHRRRLLSDRIHPGAGGAGTDRAAPGRGVRRRLHDDRHGDQRRHGPDRAAAAEREGTVRRGVAVRGTDRPRRARALVGPDPGGCVRNELREMWCGTNGAWAPETWP